MANSATTAFIGTVVDMILERLILGTESINKGLINLITSKYSDVYIPRMDHAVDVLQDRVPTPTTSTDITYDERVISPKNMMAYTRFLPASIGGEEGFGENLWSNFWPTGPMVDQSVNPKVLSAILSTFSKRINNQLDRLIWQGDTSLMATDPLRFFDGYLTLMAADGDVIDVAGAVPDATNIIGILENVLAAVPDAVFEQNPDVKIVTSHKVARFFDEALRALSVKGVDPTEGGVRTFGGVPLVAVHGMTDTNIVAGAMSAGEGSNFHAATWMDSDWENIKVDRLQSDSEYWFAKVLFRFGVETGWGQEAVLYTGS